MNFGEIFTALHQGTISAQENPLSIISSSKLYEVQDYLTVWNYAYDPLVLTCNLARWRQLSPDDQQLITACGREAMAYQRRLVAADDRRLLQELAASGMQVAELDPDEINRFRGACADVYTTFAGRIGTELVREVEAEVARTARGQASRGGLPERTTE